MASRRLAVLLLGAHLAAVTTLTLMLGDVPAIILWGLGILVCLSLVHSLRRHVLHSDRSAIVRAHWSATGDWTLHTAAGDSVCAQLAPDTYVHLHLVILNFKAKTRRHGYSLVLLPDSVPPATLRQLRVRLRTEGRRMPSAR